MNLLISIQITPHVIEIPRSLHISRASGHNLNASDRLDRNSSSVFLVLISRSANHKQNNSLPRGRKRTTGIRNFHHHSCRQCSPDRRLELSRLRSHRQEYREYYRTVFRFSPLLYASLPPQDEFRLEKELPMHIYFRARTPLTGPIKWP